ncbi:MAG TPA: MarR family winged helix-turn-helix transcriptional regulator [Stellaceae bacterium]|jgi:DNA-binding MarR family transcriptional regulator|nr:MarR family winged helix-turn-helix transcriptional regulator [Stellaceae bacterium]
MTPAKPNTALSAPESAANAQFDLLDYVPYLINRVAVGMVKSLARDLKRYGLDIQTWRILAAILSHAECRFGDLARTTSIESSTLSRIVARMQRDGLLRCRALQSDSRTFLASLTPKGRALTLRVLPSAYAAEAAMVEGLAPAEISAFTRTLHKLYDNLDKRHPNFDKPKRAKP